MSRRVLTFSIPIDKLTVQEAAALLLALLEVRVQGARPAKRRCPHPRRRPGASPC
jgi:hypothetical protein